MTQIIKIEKISERIEFAISLLDYLFRNNEKIRIHIRGKLYDQDKKSINKINKSPLILRLLFKHYTFIFEKESFDNIKSMLYKYFAYDWGYIINTNHSGSFKYNKNEFLIYCSPDEKIQVGIILGELAYKKIITSYEEIF